MRMKCAGSVLPTAQASKAKARSLTRCFGRSYFQKSASSLRRAVTATFAGLPMQRLIAAFSACDAENALPMR